MRILMSVAVLLGIAGLLWIDGASSPARAGGIEPIKGGILPASVDTDKIKAGSIDTTKMKAGTVDTSRLLCARDDGSIGKCVLNSLNTAAQGNCLCGNW